VTTKVDLTSAGDGDTAGLIVFGYDYAWIGIKQEKTSLVLAHAMRREAVKGQPQEERIPYGLSQLSIYVRVIVRASGKCQFAFSNDGQRFTNIGEPFTATVGRWVGAKVGLFAAGSPGAYADFDFFRVTPIEI
jgi:beta-xylosidase